MKKHILLPTLAWVGGIVGFVLRKWELNIAYDVQANLMHVTTVGILLTVLMVGLAAVFFLGSRGMGRRTGEDWFYLPVPGYAMVALAGGLVLAIAGLVSLWKLYTGEEQGYMLLLAAILLALGGAMATAATPNIYGGSWSERTSILLMGPAFGAVLWLVGVYQQHVRQPDVQIYSWQVLSAVAMVLALYGQVGLALDKGGAGRTCVYGLMAVAMMPIALADGVTLVNVLVWLGGAIWLTAQSYLLLRVAFGPERPERMCPAEDDAQPEEEIELEEPDNGQ